MSKNTETWIHEFHTPDIADSYPKILMCVCDDLHDIIFNQNIEQLKSEVDFTKIKVTYKIERKIKNKRRKLKEVCGKYKKVNDNDLEKTCTICLENFKKGEYKRKLKKCTHEFHKKCIDKWLYSDPEYRCPICRKSQIE